MLARRSIELLEHYRRGESLQTECPLKKALEVREGSTLGRHQSAE
jgi:hypothetical protein